MDKTTFSVHPSRSTSKAIALQVRRRKCADPPSQRNLLSSKKFEESFGSHWFGGTIDQ
jgi:hypothetical protein